MFEWLNNLKPGDQVTVRDRDHNRLGQFPERQWAEVVSEITADHIKTLPVGYVPGSKTIEPFRLFDRRFGSSNTEELRPCSQ